MEDSVEERVLDIQQDKRKLVGKAFQEKSKGKKAKDLRMADLQKLLA
jgi:SWI/SNF-related matrix-associated actin-dependent regulator of chromatin subfamily A3